MNKLLTIFFLVLAFSSYGQFLPVLPKGLPSPKTNGYSEIGYYRADSGWLTGSRDTMWQPAQTGTVPVGAIVFWQNAYWGRDLQNNFWYKFGTSSDLNNYVNKADSNTVGGYVTPSYADDRYTIRVTQNPTATITPSYTLQKRISDTTLNVNYTYGRLSATSSARATDNIVSVVVDGVNRSFTNPAAGNSGSGSASIVYTPSATKTVPIVVTTADGKTNPTATISITANSFTYYRGFVNTSTPSDVQLWALAQSVFPSTIKGTSGQTLTLPAPTGAQWYVFAYPASLGTASFIINGFGATLTLIQRNVTNTNGFSELFNIYVAQTPTAGSITYLIN